MPRAGAPRPVSCDMCRRRKVRCVVSATSQQCESCLSNEIPCTYKEAETPKPRKPYGRALATTLSPAVQPPQEPAGPSNSRRRTGRTDPDSTSARVPSLDPSLTQMPPYAGSVSLADSPLGPVDHSDPLPTIDEVLSWSSVCELAQLYHQRLFPRLPIVHWQSFSEDLMRRRDTTDIDFRRFLFSLLAYILLFVSTSQTILQHPVPPSTRQKCHRASRRIHRDKEWAVSLDIVRSLYCDYSYLRTCEMSDAADLTLAHAMRAATMLGLHEQQPVTEETDRVDMEVRKRVFWLIYVSDRTTVVLVPRPALINDIDVTVEEPQELDDALITPRGCLIDPSVRPVPIISGFVQLIRVFRLLSRVVTLRLRLKRSHGQFPECSDEIQAIQEGLNAGMETVPPGLDPMSDYPPALTSYDKSLETCRANILVTQSLVRIELHRVALMAGFDDVSFDMFTIDILRRLDRLSSDSLHANGCSMPRKVMMLASHVLEGKTVGTEQSWILEEMMKILSKSMFAPDPDA